MKQLTIMMLVPDRARADVAIKEDRIYYRFTTDSTEDEGELPGLKDRFDLIVERIVEGAKPRPNETPVPAEEMKISMFADNMVKPTAGISEQAVRRIVDELVRIDDAFTFMQGFL